MRHQMDSIRSGIVRATCRRAATIALGLAAIMTLTAAAHAAPASEPEASADTLRATYERARALYEQGVGALASSPERAAGLFTESAALLRSLVETESGSPRSWDASLLTGAAHASLQAGDVGRAVLYYRRAAVLAPLDQSVRRGLSQAQEKSGTQDAQQPRVERIAAAMEVVPMTARGIVTLVAWAGLWLSLATRAGRRTPRSPRWLVIGCGAAAGVGAATFVPLELLRRSSTEAVILSSTTPRQGPDEAGYAAARTEPWKPGTELRVVERRGDWCCVSQNGTDRAWVKAAAVARVFGAQ